jgi:hypothetical protein
MHGSSKERMSGACIRKNLFHVKQGVLVFHVKQGLQY